MFGGVKPAQGSRQLLSLLALLQRPAYKHPRNICGQQSHQYLTATNYLHVPLPVKHELIPESESSNTPIDDDYQDEHETNEPIPFNQEALHDLIRDPDLSNEKAKFLGSRLKQQNLLNPHYNCSSTS